MNRNPSALKASFLSPQATSPTQHPPLILQKWENNSVRHQLSPLRQSDWTLGVAGSVFAVRQLHPAGCVVGVPSVVWELCLQDTALPGEKGRGDFTHYSSAIWLLSLYHMHLTSFKFWLLPACHLVLFLLHILFFKYALWLI